MTQWTLSIDFGTTNTAAAVASLGHPSQVRVVKLASAATEMPSGVLVDGDEFVAGETASHMARTRPADAFEPTPKRRIGEREVVLAGRPIATDRLIAAVLEEVSRRARRHFDDTRPAALLLTHPARWARQRKDVLVAAARHAGLPEPVLVPEPVAAAAYYNQEHGVTDGPLAVYDLGGGTFDIAVLQPAGDGFETLATDMVDPLGGELFDQQLLDLVGAALAENQHDELAAMLREPDQLGWRRTLLDEVRRAKHVLSERASATVAVQREDHAAAVTITRDQFEAAIRPELSRALEATQRALDLASLNPGDLSRLCLTGGSTFIPLVASSLREQFDLAPATYDDPKTITAAGTHHAATNTIKAPTPRPPAPGPEDVTLTAEQARTGKTLTAAGGHGRTGRWRTLPRHRRVVLGAGAGLFIAYFLPWFRWRGVPQGNAWTWSFRMLSSHEAWRGLGAIGGILLGVLVVWEGVRLSGKAPDLRLEPDLLTAGLAGASATLTLLLFLSGVTPRNFYADFGAILGLILVLGLGYGAFLSFRAAQAAPAGQRRSKRDRSTP